MKAEDLKNSILQLAMEGKLVPQNPNDEPASVLLDKIREEKEQLINEKKIKRNNKESFIFRNTKGHFYEKVGKKGEPICIDDELPFEIPDNWEIMRLDDIGVYKKGPFGSALKKSLFVPKSEDTIKVYEQKNAIQKNSTLGEYYITKEYYQSKMKGFTVESGDIIVSCAGTIGETYVLPECIELGIINQALMRMNIVPSIYLDYFLIYFDYILKKSAIEYSKGSAIKNIPPFKIFKRLIFPLPPIDEQKRIVNKIEEFLPLINDYGESEEKLSKLNSEFPDKLRSSILQEAIKGKLLPQNSNDEPASVLLEKIRDEKERLIKEKKIKRNKNESYIFKENNHFYEKTGKKDPICIDEEIPFYIPDSWEWGKLENLIELISGRDLKKTQYNDLKQGIPYVTGASNIINGQLLINRWTDEPAVIAIKNDILLSCKGTIGKILILNEDKVHIARQIMSIRLIDENLINKDYIVIFLMYYVTNLINIAKSMIPGISREDVLKINIPLPPIEEQKRIVEKIDLLFEELNF